MGGRHSAQRTELTTSGPYGLVRHPLYIGSFMMMVGFCQLIDDAENIWFVSRPGSRDFTSTALNEEKTLAAAFPDQWPEFAATRCRVSSLRRLPKQLFSTWSLKQWIKNREYQAFGAASSGPGRAADLANGVDCRAPCPLEAIRAVFRRPAMSRHCFMIFRMAALYSRMASA